MNPTVEQRRGHRYFRPGSRHHTPLDDRAQNVLNYRACSHPIGDTDPANSDSTLRALIQIPIARSTVLFHLLLLNRL